MTYTLNDNSIVFATNQDKLEILQHNSAPSLFLNLTFFHYRDIQLSFRSSYLFYLKENYQYSIDFSRKLKRYFDYINIDQSYSTLKLESLRKLKKELIDKDIIVPTNILKYMGKPVYSVNNMPVPVFFQPTEIIDLELVSKVDAPATLYSAKDQVQSCFSVYEKTVELLEKGISISNIKILNASREDEYYLQKLFDDSGLPLVFDHPMLIHNHPKGIELLKIIRQAGYNASIEYLNKLLQDKSLDPLTNVLVRIYNSYKQANLENHLDILVQLIDEASILPTHYTNCVMSSSFDDVVYDEDHYYLLMNYNDQTMPKITKRTEYLNAEELEEIGYCLAFDEQQYNEQYSQTILNGIKNLSLFFSAYSEVENRISDIKLAREIVTIDYQYLVKETSYLKTLNQLEYAKSNYNYHNYYLERLDYELLHNTYHSNKNVFNHEFTGIHENTLRDLLQKHNTITGAKVESYHLCQFQYLLKYLLKIDDYETSIPQYLGTLSHKVLEEFILNKQMNYKDVINKSTDFPEEEKYKESIYKTAITGEMDHLIMMMKEFHAQSKFKDITPETRFKIPFRLNENYYLTGTIDKVMSYTDELGKTFYALIDYKLSNKDFKIEEFLTGRSMQLPVYLYAYKATQSNEVIPLGFYYQTTTLGRYKRSDTLKNNYQLAGISLEDSSILKKFDLDLSHIKAVRFNKDESLAKSTNRLKTKKEIDEILKETEHKIQTMIKGIESGEFAINPVLVKGIGKDSVSCEYCGFYSICYNKNKRLGGDSE